MNCFKLTIEYDGADYHGWQRQKERSTIQGEIEKALAVMTREQVVLTGSGRTDAGVHALGQVAGFRCRAAIPPDAFRKGLNSLLPDDIVIRRCEAVDETFHARYDVLSKCYRYRILNRAIPSALERRYVWHVRRPLDTAAMRLAARNLLGSHDFKAFEGAGSPRSTTIRHISRAELSEHADDILVFHVEGSGFLRFMVRNIVSTLVDTGHGKITPGGFQKILRSRDRSLAGPTAPPNGLFLVSVTYRDARRHCARPGKRGL